MTPAVALNRFGLGARPDDRVPGDPRAWLVDQFDRYDPSPPLWASLPTSSSLAADYMEDGQAIRAGQDEAAKMEARRQRRMEARATHVAAIQVRAASALVTPAPFVERLVHFWANHFAVSADKAVALPFIAAFEAEAIRPHVLGRFEDMLMAVEQHPAMQLYLDQTRSAGPQSRLATRAAERHAPSKPGLNENLAREIMELHTLGARTGYSQADVTEFARALTGWSIGGPGRGGVARGEPGHFLFRPALHEPGARTILGKTYPQPGAAQAQAVLHDLAGAPPTARHIATKLARHFVADDPSPALVDRLADSFTRRGGDLPAVYRALVEAPESAAPAASKFKTPWEWLISALRGIGMDDPAKMRIAGLMQQLGQPVWRPGSPAGYDDVAASWAAPDALVRRVELAQRFATQAGDAIDPRTLAPKLLPDVLSDATAQGIAQAESLSSGLALLLVSPDFLRR